LIQRGTEESRGTLWNAFPASDRYKNGGRTPFKAMFAVLHRVVFLFYFILQIFIVTFQIGQ